VRFEGRPLAYSIRALRRFRSRVQMVLAGRAGSLNPRHTVYESVAEGIRLHKRVATDEQHRSESELVSAALAEAGLRPPERVFLRYPARALGRAEAAGSDRRSADPEAGAGAGRRTRLLARRLDPR